MKTVLCYGDSNAWGFIPAKATRYEYEQRWPGIVAGILGGEYRIIEDSISGRTSVYDDPCVNCRSGKDGLGYALLANAPIDLVILAVGGNDLKFTDSDGSMRGVARLVDLIRNADSVYDSYAPIFPNGCRILLLGPTVFSPEISVKRPGHALANSVEESKLLAEKFKRVAEEKNIYFLDESKYAYPSDRDCIHLLPEDHERLGKVIAEEIKRIFA